MRNSVVISHWIPICLICLEIDKRSKNLFTEFWHNCHIDIISKKKSFCGCDPRKEDQFACSWDRPAEGWNDCYTEGTLWAHWVLILIKSNYLLQSFLDSSHSFTSVWSLRTYRVKGVRFSALICVKVSFNNWFHLVHQKPFTRKPFMLLSFEIDLLSIFSYISKQ